MQMTPPPGGHMGVHGMVMFGKNYLSHIPMFHEPHDYQIIMDVHLDHPQIGPEDNFGQSLHTFVPDKFSLGDLLNGKLEKIQGTVYEGNFEDGGKPVLGVLSANAPILAAGADRMLQGASRRSRYHGAHDRVQSDLGTNSKQADRVAAAQQGPQAHP